MFRNFFKRAKAAPAEPEPIARALDAAVTKKVSAEDIREEWESSFLVIEGKGSESDWGSWAEAEEAVDFAFARTSPTPLGPK